MESERDVCIFCTAIDEALSLSKKRKPSDRDTTQCTVPPSYAAGSLSTTCDEQQPVYEFKVTAFVLTCWWPLHRWWGFWVMIIINILLHHFLWFWLCFNSSFSSLPLLVGWQEECPMAPCGSRVERIDPLSFLAGCHKRRLNQAFSIFLSV